MTKPNAPTEARPKIQAGGGHWYDQTGMPCYEVKKADGSGMRATTLADARKNKWFPSVTTILKVIDKPQLTNWRIEQACLAIVTAPRLPDEKDDAFVKRVIQDEQQHEQEGKAARDKGTEIHDALEAYFGGDPVPEPAQVYVNPVIEALLKYGQKASSEIILVGEGYAGKTDLIQDCEEFWRMWDFKTTKTMPDPRKGAYAEHRLQLAAYGKAFVSKLRRAGDKKPLLVGNIYISTLEPGLFLALEHEDWESVYEQGFAPMVRYWQWSNQYWPNGAPVAAPVASPDVEQKLAEVTRENGRLKSQVEDLRFLLNRKTAEQPAPAAQAAEPEPVATVQTAPAPTTASAPAAPPAKALPSTIGGKKVTWTAGIPAPSSSQPPQP